MTGVPNQNINFRAQALRCQKAAQRQLKILREQREKEAAAVATGQDVAAQGKQRETT
jgi:hypothetical protein